MINFKMIKCHTLDFLFLRLVKVDVLMRSSLRCQGPGIQQGQLKFEDNSSIQGNSQCKPTTSGSTFRLQAILILIPKKEKKMLDCSRQLIYIQGVYSAATSNAS
jgi:hypothetical protein